MCIWYISYGIKRAKTNTRANRHRHLVKEIGKSNKRKTKRKGKEADDCPERNRMARRVRAGWNMTESNMEEEENTQLKRMPSTNLKLDLSTRQPLAAAMYHRIDTTKKSETRKHYIDYAFVRTQWNCFHRGGSVLLAFPFVTKSHNALPRAPSSTTKNK